MKYLSAKEIAEKWGLSLRSVQYYCANGRIPGAQNLGKQWIIPADAVHPSDCRIKYLQTNDTSYSFPLFIYSPAYSYGENLQPIEYALFTAQLKYLEGKYSESIRMCREVLSIDAPFHVSIGAYYTIALCSIVLGNHYEYKKAVTKMEEMSPSDELHLEDYKLLIYSIKRMIGWNHKIYDNLDATKLSSEALYFFQYECLLSETMSDENVSDHARHIYDALALQIASEGIGPLDANFRFPLAALHFHSEDSKAKELFRTACEISVSNNWLNILSKNHNFGKTLMKNTLDKIPQGDYKKTAKMADREFDNWRMVNRQESGIYPFKTFSPCDISVLFMVYQGLSNNTICTIMDLSPVELSDILQDCYKTVNVRNKNELKKYAASQLSTWFK